MPRNVDPFPPSTSPWDTSFVAGGSKGAMTFPSAVAPNASPLVPIVQQATHNVQGTAVAPALPSFWESTSIQLAMNGADGGTTFTDQRFGLTVSTVAQFTTEDAAFKFGGSSAYGTGVSASSTGINYATQTRWNLGAGNFTLEGWFKSSQAQQYTILATRSDGSFSAGSWSLLMNTASSSDGILSFWAKEYSGAAAMITGTVKHTDDVWHHVAVCRVGTTWSLYCDGVREASIDSSISITDSSLALSFGGGAYFNRTLLGYLDMWRLVKGVSVYTGSNFTVPAAPFPTS